MTGASAAIRPACPSPSRPRFHVRIQRVEQPSRQGERDGHQTRHLRTAQGSGPPVSTQMLRRSRPDKNQAAAATMGPRASWPSASRECVPLDTEPAKG